MKKVIVFIIIIAVALVAAPTLVFARGGYDNLKGTFSDKNGPDIYDDASGKVTLNYNSGKQEWVVNIVVKGLLPGVKYQALISSGSNDPGTVLVCDNSNPNGVLHINTKIPGGTIDSASVIDGSARVTIRTTDGSCTKLPGAAVLTTLTKLVNPNWDGSGLIPVGSNRPD